jgi:hypothetical protein
MLADNQVCVNCWDPAQDEDVEEYEVAMVRGFVNKLTEPMDLSQGIPPDEVFIIQVAEETGIPIEKLPDVIAELKRRSRDEAVEST